MPRKKRAASPFDLFDDVFDDDCSSKSGNPPIQRNAANARERARMRVLSSAFGRLKTKLPNIPPDTKLSKLDTLRLATMYIKQLKNLVDNNGSTSGSSSAENTDSSFSDDGEGLLNKSRMGAQITWPFALHHLQNSNRQNPVAHLSWPASQPNSFYKLSAYEQSPNEAAYSHPTSTNQQFQCNSTMGHWYRDDCVSRNGPTECSYAELMPTPMQQDHELQYNAEQFGHMQL